MQLVCPTIRVLCAGRISCEIDCRLPTNLGHVYFTATPSDVRDNGLSHTPTFANHFACIYFDFAVPIMFEEETDDPFPSIPTPQSEHVENEVILISLDNCVTVADRTILASNSADFRAWVEGLGGDDVAISVKLDGESLEMLLDTCHGHVNIDVGNVLTIFHASLILGFDRIQNRCFDVIKDFVGESTVYDLMKADKISFKQKLIDATHNHILQNFSKIVQSPELDSLDWRQLESCVGDDNLCIASEVEAYQAIFKWLMYSYTKRLPYIPHLLKQIRLPQLGTDFLKKHVSHLAKSANCLPLIDAAIDYTQQSHEVRFETYASLPFNPFPRASNRFHIYSSSCASNRSIRSFHIHNTSSP